MTHHQSIDGQDSFSDEPMKVQLEASPTFDVGGDDHQGPAQIWEGGNAQLWSAEALPFCSHVMPAWNWNWPDNYNHWEHPIQPMAVVRFHGLLRATDWHGDFGVVDRWDAQNERWAVVMPDGQERFAKTENLEVVMPDASVAFLNPLDAQPPVFWSDYWPGRTSYGYQRPRNAANRRETKKGNAPKQRVSATPCARLMRERSNSDASDSTSTGGTDAIRSILGDEGGLVRAGSSGSLVPAVRTSVMMRNVPNDMTRDLLAELLIANGFDGCFDFLYLPIDFVREAALGYAFINLTTHEEAERFQQYFSGFSGWPVSSPKVCETAWSDLDGLQAHVDRYRNSPVQHESVHDKFKPALFDKSGVRIDFPPATKSIRAPRFKTRVPVAKSTE